MSEGGEAGSDGAGETDDQDNDVSTTTSSSEPQHMAQPELESDPEPEPEPEPQAEPAPEPVTSDKTIVNTGTVDSHDFTSFGVRLRGTIGIYTQVSK